MSDQIIDAYWQMPPVARTMATAALATSVGIYAGLLPGRWVIFHHMYIFKFPPEIWRFPTSFLITSPGLGLLFDTYFLYTYLRELEVGHPRFPRKEDLVWYLICVSLMIIGINEIWWRYTPILSGPYVLFLSGLLISIVYTATQDMRGRKSTLWFFSVPSQLMPYCMILMTLLQGGVDSIPLMFAGIIAAHLWDFLTRLWPEFGGGRNLLPTPAFVSRLVTTPRMLRREYGTAIRAQDVGTSGSSTGVSSGPLPESWRSRGPGRRLGGE